MALAACGGVDKATFVHKSDAICTRAAVDTNHAFAAVGSITDQHAAVALMTKLILIRQREHTALKALQAPSGASSTFAAMLADRAERLSNLRAGLAAAERGDVATYNRIARDNESIGVREDAVAAKIGFQACAERLPPSQQAAAAHVVVRNATVNDPSECTDSYTGAYVTAHFGSEARCFASQRGRSAVTRVDIARVAGVAGVSATVTAIPHGPAAVDGREFVARLVYEDGRWKQDSLEPVS